MLNRAMRVAAALPRVVQAARATGLRAAAAVAPQWPPVSPAVSLSTTGDIPAAATPSASEVLGLLDDEDEETRFRRKKDGDRGPTGAGSGARSEGGARDGRRAGSWDAVTSGSDDDTLRGSDSDEPGAVDAVPDLPADIVRMGLGAAVNDEPYRGPVMDALVLPRGLGGRRGGFALRAGVREGGMPTRGGHPANVPDAFGSALGTAAAELASVVPLDDEDFDRLAASRTPVGGRPATTPEERALLARRAVLARRAMRATYTPEQAAAFTHSVIAQHGRDLEAVPLHPGEEPDNLMAVRTEADYRRGADPLERAALPFRASAVTLCSNMTWNAPPGARAIDAKATLTARVDRLGLSKAQVAYLRLIAGPRFSTATGTLRFSSEKHRSAAANKRELVEQLVALVKEAKAIEAKHGPAKKSRPAPAYCH